MGCCGDREKGIDVVESQKWDYLTLSDFKSTSCLAPLSYVWLWVLVLISGAVYAADAFTAVSLLAFDKWSSEVKPAIRVDIAKWIFAGCIIASYVFLVYRWIRAIRVIRSGSVTECYLEPMAAIWQSMRITKSGQGWRRFLVFAELTRSRKGVDYMALFVYFQFKGALIVVLAQGPRIAINAMTLWAVMQAQIIPVGQHASKDHPAFVQFFMNIQTMAQTGNRTETIIYFTMLFSLVIWVIAALSLLISVLFYILYLWHHVDKSDGSLTQYCRRKIESRLERIVGKKIKKALEKQDKKRRIEEQKAIGKGEAGPRMPTLPKLGGQDDDTASMYSMSTTVTYSSHAPSRNNTMSTTGTARTAAMKPTLPSLSERPMASRTDTQGTAFSTASYGSNAPLLSQAGDMGLSSSPPPMPALDRNADYFNGPPNRGRTPNGMAGRPYPPMMQGRDSPSPPRAMLPPVDTQFNGRNSPAPSQAHLPYANRRPVAPPQNVPGFSPYDTRGPAMGPAYEMSPVDVAPSSNYAPESQQDYTTFTSPDDYRQPQLPNALRTGTPAQTRNYQSSNSPEEYRQPQFPSALHTASPAQTQNYQTGNSPDEYRQPQFPSALRTGSPAQMQGSGPPSRTGTAPPPGMGSAPPPRMGSAPPPRMGTAPPPRMGTAPPPRMGTAPPPRTGTAPPMNPRAGIPAGLQAATQRREASQPLPYRGPGTPQQRSATAPLRQPGFRPAPTDRSDTTPPGQDYNNNYGGY